MTASPHEAARQVSAGDDETSAVMGSVHASQHVLPGQPIRGLPEDGAVKIGP
jgi:hypothetical protein